MTKLVLDIWEEEKLLSFLGASWSASCPSGAQLKLEISNWLTDQNCHKNIHWNLEYDSRSHTYILIIPDMIKDLFMLRWL